MRITKTSAKMRFVDVTALNDSELTTQDNRDIGNINLFKTERNQRDYATLELNQFVLDGVQSLMADDINDVAFWSKEVSDENNNINAEVVVNFTKAHTSDGLTLYFAYEYPAKLRITWYSLGGMILASEIFEPNDLIYHCKKQVSNYGRFKIEFLETQFPERMVKLQYILYGVDLDWVDKYIKSATVKEEIDPTSQTLSINTATLTIIDANNEFDITRDVGAWKSIQKNQQIMLYETVDGVTYNMGTFYIDKFTFKENQVLFEMIDAVGLMDKYQFEVGKVYSKTTAGTILEQIFETAGIGNYSISDEVYNTKVNGWLEVQTCREALQMVCIACGALVDTSRGNIVKVFIPDRDMHSIVTTDRKFLGTEVSLSTYYSGIKIKYTTYEKGGSAILFNGWLEKGIHKIILNEPCQPKTVYAVDEGPDMDPEDEDDFGLESTGDSIPIVEVNYNYVVVNVPEKANVYIRGRKYNVTEYFYTRNNEIEAGETESIKEIGTLTLRNSNGLDALATKLLDYYSLRKRIKTKFIMESESVGQWAGIMCDKTMSVTFFESNDIDLTGGFISTSECVGYSKEVVNLYYTGELYAGSEGII